MAAGLNALEIVGLVTTVKFAELEGGPTGNNVVDTPLVVFGFVPICTLLTVKVRVQPAAGIVSPVKLSEVCPAVSAVGVRPVQPAPVTVTVWPTLTCMLTSVSEKLALV